MPYLPELAEFDSFILIQHKRKIAKGHQIALPTCIESSSNRTVYKNSILWRIKRCVNPIVSFSIMKLMKYIVYNKLQKIGFWNKKRHIEICESTEQLLLRHVPQIGLKVIYSNIATISRFSIKSQLKIATFFLFFPHFIFYLTLKAGKFFRSNIDCFEFRPYSRCDIFLFQKA